MIRLLTIFSKNINLPDNKNVKLTHLKESNKFYALSDENLIILEENGNTLQSFSDFSAFKPVVVSLQNQNFVIGAAGSNLNLYRSTSQTEFPLVTTSIEGNEEVSSAPIFAREHSFNFFQKRKSIAVFNRRYIKVCYFIFISSSRAYN